ncbi:MAG: recombinase family protein [Pseudomonadota bacterium]
MPARCYAYIRTSTIKQGTEGVSLEAQHDAITAYAARHKLTIVEWFSETQTAAKRGRPVFSKMMKALSKRKVDGLILHRIDRGSRNLKDWSDISDLSDIGLQVHFAHDSVDLNTRGGRLAADVQAVVAADFIRNLREETKKGLLGRLKQGYYPFGAPTGYLNQGRAKVKIMDPIKGPLVRTAFDLYGTGRHSFNTLRQELYRLGLRTPNGKPLSLNGLTAMFNNPFYMGLMRLRSTGELFPGLHTPLVHPALFERVQDVLHGRVSHRGLKHQHIYRRDIACVSCNQKLIGETQKKVYVYYRCHNTSCIKTSIREEMVSKSMEEDLLNFRRMVETYTDLDKILELAIADLIANKAKAVVAISLERAKLDVKLSATTDAVIEGLIDKETYVEKKNAITQERVRLDEIIAQYETENPPEVKNARRYLELAKCLRDGFFLGSPLIARDICKETTSNFIASGKNITLQWEKPFNVFVEKGKALVSDPIRDTRRTLEEFAVLLLGHIDPLQRPHVPTSKELEIEKVELLEPETG